MTQPNQHTSAKAVAAKKATTDKLASEVTFQQEVMKQSDHDRMLIDEREQKARNRKMELELTRDTIDAELADLAKCMRGYELMRQALEGKEQGISSLNYASIGKLAAL